MTFDNTGSKLTTVVYVNLIVESCLYCTNGIVDTSKGESCDDNNSNPGDGCSSTCTIETGYSCSGNPSVCTPICGDGRIISPETCDDGPASHVAPYGVTGCLSTCVGVDTRWSCSGGDFSTPSSCNPICGDGKVVGSEFCDD